MIEITIAGRRLSSIAAELRKLKADAAKVVDAEMKRVAGLVWSIWGSDETAAASLAAQAMLHLRNAISVASTMGIPIPVGEKEPNQRLWHALSICRTGRTVSECRELWNKLYEIENNPANWA